MSRISLLPGQRFEHENKIYEIQKLLYENKVSTVDLTYNRERIFDYSEIVNALFKGNLRFEVYGKNTKAEENKHVTTKFLVSDFTAIDEHYRNIAIERLEIIKPLLNSKKRKNDVVDRIDLVQNPKIDNLKHYAGKRLSVSTIYNWIKAYESSGDIRSLVPTYGIKGYHKKSRLPEDVDKIIAAVISSHYLTKQKNDMSVVHQEVKAQIFLKNQSREEGEKLIAPCYATIRNKIQSLDPYLVDSIRYGKYYADQKYKVATGEKRKKATRPLEVVHIDHTPLDIFVVDEEDRLPIGRPFLTFAIDEATDYPLGFSLSFTNPSYETVAECIYNAVIPKMYMKDKYPEIRFEWLAWGLPETILVDNGKEFKSKHLEEAALQLGIHINFARPRKGEDKSEVERYFGTIKNFIHQLPGTTFSNIIDRGEYNSLSNAVISLQALEQILHLIMVSESQKPDSKLRFDSQPNTPLQRWLKACENFPPSLPHAKEELWPILGAVDYRTIGRSGIQFHELTYTSPELAKLRMKLGNHNEKLKIKYHPGDISRIYVWNPFMNEYIEIYCRLKDYANGLSLWKHNIIVQYLRKKYNEISDQNFLLGRNEIQEIVNNEWFKSGKRKKSRQALARLKETELDVFKQLRDDISKQSNDGELPLPDEIQVQAVEVVGNSVVEILEYENRRDNSKRNHNRSQVADRGEDWGDLDTDDFS